jgi:hypothetical protein
MSTLAEQLAATLRTAAHAYAAGDQVAPCAVLWPDPERLWESVMPELQPMLPELFLLGSYVPEKRTGPALWLRIPSTFRAGQRTGGVRNRESQSPRSTFLAQLLPSAQPFAHIRRSRSNSDRFR